jgi:hypothetical protein
MKNIFIPVVGQFINIGDVLHRRELLSWLKDEGELHIYVGKAPESFIDGLQLNSNAKLYVSLTAWMMQLLISKYKRTYFVFNPGEIRLERRRLLREILLFPLLCLVRLKRGKVLRVGIAAMSESVNRNILTWKMVFKTTNKIYWRTFDSEKKFDRGEVIPDLAFSDVDEKSINSNNRTYLTISMRGNHPEPCERWFDIVKSIGVTYDLEIITVSQVRSDNERALEISKKLGVKSFIWLDKCSHNEQEKIVNDLYKNSLIIVSDRLHALILAYTRGALPINLLTTNKEKIQHHFDVIGINKVNYLINDKSDVSITLREVQKVVDERDFYIERLLVTKERLENLREEIKLLLN